MPELTVAIFNHAVRLCLGRMAVAYITLNVLMQPGPD